MEIEEIEVKRHKNKAARNTVKVECMPPPHMKKHANNPTTKIPINGKTTNKQQNEQQKKTKHERTNKQTNKQKLFHRLVGCCKL